MPHYLNRTGKTRTPEYVLTFDTETFERPEEGGTVQTLRCWSAILRERKPRAGVVSHTAEFAGTTSASLADVVEAGAERTKELWVIAHNAGFDIAVTALPFVLDNRGWVSEVPFLAGDTISWVLKRDGYKIVITDSWSWLRCSLEEAAKDVKMRKVVLPGQEDDLEAWHKRCRYDVRILDKLMCELMDWWESEKLGSLGMTGPGCGWRTLRNKVGERRPLVGPEEGRTDHERRAVYGGRKEVYGVGTFSGSWIADYDFVAAYPWTVAGLPLPLRPLGRGGKWSHALVYDPPPRQDALCEVEITTRRPCAPCRVDGEVWWPVGTFTTVLCGPEIRQAVTVADKVKIITADWYETGFALAEWATWLLELQFPFGRPVPPVVSRIAKAWGRTVIGRFAMHTSRIDSSRPATTLGWELTTGHDITNGVPVDLFSMNGTEYTIYKDQDGAEVFPAVLAFVESYVRAAMDQMLSRRNPVHVLQCNTDGWWEQRAVRKTAYQVENVPAPYRVVRKALERSLVVLGPDHVATPSERRYGGIPRSAAESDAGVMTWQDWPSLRWQFQRSGLGEYHRPEKEAHLEEHYCRRWVLETGETIPVTTAVTASGENVIEPWGRSWGRLVGDELATYQVPELEKLRDDDAPFLALSVVELPPQPGRGFRRLDGHRLHVS